MLLVSVRKGKWKNKGAVVLVPENNLNRLKGVVFFKEVGGEQSRVSVPAPFLFSHTVEQSGHSPGRHFELSLDVASSFPDRR